MTANRSPRTPEEVMADLAQHLPAVAEHCYMDRSWIWYCGPSLAGDTNKPTRETLSALGFRYAPKGHTMQDGQTVGTWSHSCDQPRKRIFRGRHNHHNHQHEEADNALNALAALNV